MSRRLKKIKGGLNPRYVKQISNPSNSNNLKTIQELQQLNIIDYNNFFLDEEGNIINDPILQEPIIYEKAILINKNLLNIDELYKWIFKENIQNYKKIDYYRNTIKITDTIKIFNLFHKINPNFDEFKLQFEFQYNDIIIISRKIDEFINIINNLLQYDLNDKIVKTILDFIYDIRTELLYLFKLILHISDINKFRVIASILFSNNLINFFNCIKIFLLNIYNIGNNNFNIELKYILFNLIIDLFQKNNDISSYNFEIIMAYSLKTNDFTEEYKEFFKKNINEVINISNKTNNYKINEICSLLNDLIRILNSTTNIKPIHKKLLLKTYEEFLKSLKNSLEAQENHLKIYKFCNSRFMNFVNHQRKDNQVLVTKAELLSQNIERLHMKSTQNLEKAKKTFEKYQNYKSPKFFQRVKRTFRNFSKRIGLPVEPSPKSPSSPEISPSIQVSPPSV